MALNPTPEELALYHQQLVAAKAFHNNPDGVIILDAGDVELNHADPRWPYPTNTPGATDDGDYEPMTPEAEAALQAALAKGAEAPEGPPPPPSLQRP